MALVKHLEEMKLLVKHSFWSLLKTQWVKTLSHRCQLIVTAAMKFFPLLQMEFPLDTGSYRVCSHDVTAAAMLEE